LDISDETTFAFDIGYQISPFWSVTFSAGVPPRLDLDGTGIFEGASYGTTLFAPIALTVQRHFYVTRKASIYVGAGINYNVMQQSSCNWELSDALTIASVCLRMRKKRFTELKRLATPALQRFEVT